MNNYTGIDEDVAGDDAHIALVEALAKTEGPMVVFTPRIPLAHILASCLPYSGAGSAEALHVLDRLEDAGFHIVPIIDPVMVRAHDSALASMANDLIAKDAQLITAMADRARALLLAHEATDALNRAKANFATMQANDQRNCEAMEEGRDLARAERDAAYRDVGEIICTIADEMGVDINVVLDSHKSLSQLVKELSDRGRADG